LDKEITFLTYLVLTLVVAICIMAYLYDFFFPYLEHQLLVNISLIIGIMAGIITSFVIFTLQQHFNKRKIQV
jgi:MFS-type transporter involved in bile tolerance (Atg22 family)